MSPPGSQSSAEVQQAAHECKTEWHTSSSQKRLSHADSLAFMPLCSLSWGAVTSSHWPSATKRASPPILPHFFHHLQGAALYFLTQYRNPKPPASQIRLPGPQRAAHTAGCSTRTAALPSRLQREPDAGNVPGWAGLAEPESLGWESQTSS